MDRLSGYEAGIVAGLKKSGRYAAFLRAADQLDRLIKIAKATGKTSPKLEKIAAWNAHLVPAVKQGMEKKALAATAGAVAAATWPLWAKLLAGLGIGAAGTAAGNWLTGDSEADKEERIRRIIAEQRGSPYQPGMQRAATPPASAKPVTRDGITYMPPDPEMAGSPSKPTYDFKNFKMPPQMAAMVDRMGYMPEVVQHMYTPMDVPEWMTPEVEAAFKKMFGKSPMDVLWEEKLNKLRAEKLKASKPQQQVASGPSNVDRYLQSRPWLTKDMPSRQQSSTYRDGYTPASYTAPYERQKMPKQPYSPARESERRWWKEHSLSGGTPEETMIEERALNRGQEWKTQREERLKKVRGLLGR